MPVTLRHIFLIHGIVISFCSFLFYGRQQDAFMLILGVGLIISFLGIVVILLGDDTRKHKLRWVLIVLTVIVFQQVTQSFFIGISYRIFINSNEKMLNTLNEVLGSDSIENLSMSVDSRTWSGFSETNSRKITESLGTGFFSIIEEKELVSIEKDPEKIFYHLGKGKGFFFFYSSKKPVTELKNIRGRWYFSPKIDWFNQ